jgi:hypothetical protein
MAGCATVIRGTTNSVGFISDPSGAEMQTSIGLACVTPCSLVIKRNETFTATFSKAGYISQQVQVVPEVVGAGVAASAGNILVGGVIGAGVDLATHAGFDHKPNPVSVKLVPEPPRASVQQRRAPAPLGKNR